MYTCINQSSKKQELLLIDVRGNLKKFIYDKFTSLCVCPSTLKRKWYCHQWQYRLSTPLKEKNTFKNTKLAFMCYLHVWPNLLNCCCGWLSKMPVLASMTVLGEYSTQRQNTEYWLNSHVLFACVTYFAELLLWLAIKSASASKSTQLIKNLLSLGLLPW